MTGVTPTGIAIDRTSSASPEHLFHAVSDASSFARWFGGTDVEVPADRLTFNASTGAEWAATMVLPDGNTIDWAGTFLRVERPTRFDFTLSDQPGEDFDGVSVTMTISPADGGSVLHMTQETPDFPEEQKMATLEGWQIFLSEVIAIAEEREG